LTLTIVNLATFGVKIFGRPAPFFAVAPFVTSMVAEENAVSSTFAERKSENATFEREASNEKERGGRRVDRIPEKTVGAANPCEGWR